jgi:transcriptional regulator with XRE-family HTH domain
MDLRVVIGRNIRRLREEQRLAQDELAHRAEIHTTYLSGVENGRRNITVLVLERIARALDVPPEALITNQ